ncbi:hypothetical protein GCM10028791_27620 [Echinicola sediminis]
MDELMLDSFLKPSMTVSFNGSVVDKERLETLMNSEELKNFQVKKQNESFYKEGMYNDKSQDNDFKYGINYQIVLGKESDKTLISEVLNKSNIPVSIHSNGFHLPRDQNKTLQNRGFQHALGDAEARIAAYADSLNMRFEIMAVEELDDYQLFPVDNIVYQDKIIKKLKVKARLLAK